MSCNHHGAAVCEIDDYKVRKWNKMWLLKTPNKWSIRVSVHQSSTASIRCTTGHAWSERFSLNRNSPHLCLFLCFSPELVKLWKSWWYFGWKSPWEGLFEWDWIYSSLLVICTAHISSIMVTNTRRPSFIKTQMRKLHCRPVFTPVVCCFRDGQCSTMLAQKGAVWTYTGYTWYSILVCIM